MTQPQILGQVTDIVRRFPAVAKASLVVTGEMANDVMPLHCEVAAPDAALSAGLVHAIWEVTKLRGDVALVGLGALANDGKVIEDARRYE